MHTRSHEHDTRKPIIDEIEVVPVKPIGGIVGFASLVLDRSLYLGSIAIITRPAGGFRLLYPTKKVGNASIDIFHPINRTLADTIERAVVSQYEDVMNRGNGHAGQYLR
jgi:DNA-binding cell septation regulator SpoVG